MVRGKASALGTMVVVCDCAFTLHLGPSYDLLMHIMHAAFQQ
jgi:hypothetical protein